MKIRYQELDAIRGIAALMLLGFITLRGMGKFMVFQLSLYLSLNMDIMVR